MGMAYGLAVRPAGGSRTWTVVDASYRTVSPVEEWLEAHRHLWSPNTVRGYVTALAQWWTFLEQRGEAGRSQEAGVPAVTGILVVAAERAHCRARAGRPGSGAVGGDPGGAAGGARVVLPLAGGRPLGSGRGTADARRAPPPAGPGLLAHLDARSAPGPSPLVRVRRIGRRDRPPLLLPQEIQAILDQCAVFDETSGEWAGNLRDRLLFSVLAESGMRLGEALGLRISDFVMGRGSTPYIEIVPRPGNPNSARVKMMRPRRIYVGGDLERLFADYLTYLACRAAGLGVPVTADSPLLVNLARPPLLAALREGTVRDKVTALRRRGIGPPGWTPHWFRHSHASALLLAGTAEWVVSRRLGHAHVQTTLDLYGWVREDEALRAAANWKTYASSWQVPDGR
jgi:integrase